MSERTVAVFRLEHLHNKAVQENLRYAWDSDNYVIIDARPTERAWRVQTESWLINNGLPYHEVIYSA